MLKQLKADLQKLHDPKRAKALARFFKTGKGEYGEGDVFIGIKVGGQRRVAKKYTALNFTSLQKLIGSKYHEHRLVTLLILVNKFQKTNEKEKEKIIDFYLKNAKRVNNWDLVDLSAPKLLGPYLLDKDRKILYKLACSKNLWEKRIGMMATATFIREGQFEDTFKIAKILLEDKHDLIHKAVGWMLREVGKRDQKAEEKFLKKHYQAMPRTMLRYAIEKFDETKRQAYLYGKARYQACKARPCEAKLILKKKQK